MPSSSVYQRYKPEIRKQLACPALVYIRDTNRNQITINMPSSSLYQRYKPEIRIQLTCPALVCISDTNQKLENNQHAQLQSVSEIQTRNKKTINMPNSSLYQRYKPEIRIKETSALKRWFIRCTARNFRFLQRVMYTIYIQPDCKTCAVPNE